MAYLQYASCFDNSNHTGAGRAPPLLAWTLFRCQSALKIVRYLLVYEPAYRGAEFFGSEVTGDLGSFKSRCDLIIANRWSDDLADVSGKVYTRDLFRRD